ncbi:hypothetical protein [Hymenobacter nivis]|uniref:PH domain-containing protein n=1 Tax=Hymenobacter nivis TaxID=1850093 RepID=A0A502GSY3_9BACT|nr:hypothetical protein [Hymenobacter nivis]TPG65487.1 hypothetical protein EAH73_13535 [Hymenobacter nivis]
MLALLNWFVVGFVALGALLGLGVPYALHLDSLKMDKPVVVFRNRPWRNLLGLLLAGMLLGMGIVLVITAVRKIDELYLVLFSLIVATALLVLGATGFWLHVTYWRHDRRAVLTIDRTSQLATYTNAGTTQQFVLADVASITQYDSYRPSGHRMTWDGYNYQIWELHDGTWLVLTCLLYSFSGPEDLLPPVRCRTVRPRICWLPGDPLLNFTFC